MKQLEVNNNKEETSYSEFHISTVN